MYDRYSVGGVHARCRACGMAAKQLVVVDEHLYCRICVGEEQQLHGSVFKGLLWGLAIMIPCWFVFFYYFRGFVAAVL